MSRFLSPFRYPGGKSWLAPEIKKIALEWFPDGLDSITEPFAGGASVSLDAICNGWAKTFCLNDADPLIANFWIVVFHDERKYFDGLISLLETKEYSQNEEVECDICFEHSYLDENIPKESQTAFFTLLKNRVAYNGILSRAYGKLRKDALSKWCPKKLIERLKYLRKSAVGKKFFCFNCSFSKMAYPKGGNHLVYFDPPYPTAGKRLYNFGHTEIGFSDLMSIAIRMPFNGIIISYEYDEWAQQFGKALGFEVRTLITPQKKKELLFLKEPNK